GISVHIPPLRERAAELESLAHRFLAEFGESLGRPELALTQDAVACIRAHTWPGNVRELRNVIERAALLSTGREVRPEHLGLPLAPEPPPSEAARARSARPNAPAPPPPPFALPTAPPPPRVRGADDDAGAAAPDSGERPQTALSDELQAVER